MTHSQAPVDSSVKEESMAPAETPVPMINEQTHDEPELIE